METLITGLALYIVAPLAILGASIWVVYWLSARETRAWEAFAKAHGLAFDKVAMAITGTFEGRPCSMKVRTYRKSTYSEYRVPFTGPVPGGMTFRKEGVLDWVLEPVLGEDLEIGDPDVDRALSLRGQDVYAVQRVFADPAARKAILHFATEHDGFIGDDGLAGIDGGGINANLVAMETRLRACVKVVNAIEAASGPPDLIQVSPDGSLRIELKQT